MKQKKLLGQDRIDYFSALGLGLLLTIKEDFPDIPPLQVPPDIIYRGIDSLVNREYFSFHKRSLYLVELAFTYAMAWVNSEQSQTNTHYEPAHILREAARIVQSSSQYASGSAFAEAHLRLLMLSTYPRKRTLLMNDFQHEKVVFHQAYHDHQHQDLHRRTFDTLTQAAYDLKDLINEELLSVIEHDIAHEVEVWGDDHTPLLVPERVYLEHHLYQLDDRLDTLTVMYKYPFVYDKVIRLQARIADAKNKENYRELGRLQSEFDNFMS